MIYPLPQVRNEFDTIAAVKLGLSLARLGDGELKLIFDQGYAREPANAKLGRELRDILQRPDVMLLPGIPTFDPRGPKYSNWLRHAVRFCQVLQPGINYYSAFVTRPDSAPWIDSTEYALSVESIWRGKKTVVVCEPKGFMKLTVARGARQMFHVPCPREEAYARISGLEQSIVDLSPEVVILSAGPTASCLAHRLAKRGIQAVDLGSMGRFIFKHLWPSDYQKCSQ